MQLADTTGARSMWNTWRGIFARRFHQAEPPRVRLEFNVSQPATIILIEPRNRARLTLCGR